MAMLVGYVDDGEHKIAKEILSIYRKALNAK